MAIIIHGDDDHHRGQALETQYNGYPGPKPTWDFRPYTRATVPYATAIWAKDTVAVAPNEVRRFYLLDRMVNCIGHNNYGFEIVGHLAVLHGYANVGAFLMANAYQLVVISSDYQNPHEIADLRTDIQETIAPNVEPFVINDADDATTYINNKLKGHPDFPGAHRPMLAYWNFLGITGAIPTLIPIINRWGPAALP